MAPRRTVHVLGVPLDLGGGRRGVDMGPSAVRIAGLGERLTEMGCSVEDKGDVDAPIPETQTERDPTQAIRPRDRARLPEALPPGVPVIRGGGAADRPWRRSLAGGRIGGCVGRFRRAQAPRDRPALDRRARRHEHAGDDHERERSRDAARGPARPRASGALAHRPSLAQGSRREDGADRRAQPR